MEAACVEDCCVKVVVHIRPLIGDEKLQGCKDCVFLVPGKPQVQLFFLCDYWLSIVDSLTYVPAVVLLGKLTFCLLFSN